MLTISKPLGSAQAKNYYQEEYSNSEANYYSREETIKGEWAGRLADEIGLRGAVKQEHFERLIDGCDPHTGDQLIRHVDERTIKNIYGEVITNKRHRAGYDATFSAPKSVSLAALVGNDARIRDAHRNAVNKALEELEKYSQARLGNVRPAATTEKFIAATFEHDTARPDQDSGYAAPQLHTHAVLINMTRLESGKWHALQPLEMYRSQQYATAVYRTVLSEELQKLGYEIEVRNGAPEIKGFTPEYLEANSPRAAEVRREAAEIKARLEAEGHTVKDGAGLRQAAATRRRRSKKFDPEGMKARHQELETTYGNQSHRAVERALNGKGIELSLEDVAKRAQDSVTFARDHAMSREAVADLRRFKTDALRRNLGLTTFDAVIDVISARRESGELLDILERNRPSRLTTQRMLELETGNIKTVLEGKGTQSPIVEIRRVDALIEEASRRQGIRLNGDQSQAVRGILTSEDRIVALQGRAGTGKTTTMQVLREVAERSGYVVRGITPTHKARKELEKSGIHSQTLHSFVFQQKHAEPPLEKRIFVLDESSLADTVKIERLFDQIGRGTELYLLATALSTRRSKRGRRSSSSRSAGSRRSI
jgi:conjugative relaxase-like TrwC/TraI family protein